MPRKILLNIAFYLFIITCSNHSIAQPEELPASAFGNLPDVTSVKLSPNGERLMSLVRYSGNGKSGVTVTSIDLATMEKKILTSTDNAKFFISWANWANDDEIIVAIRYPSSIQGHDIASTELLKFNATSGKAAPVIPKRLYKKRNYTPVVKDNVIDFLPKNKDELLLSLRLSNEVASNVMKINHKTGRTKVIHPARTNTLNWVTDRQNNVRIAFRFKDATVEHDYRDVGEKKWRPLFKYTVFSGSAADPLGFDEDPNILYFSAYHDDRRAIFKTDLSGEKGNKELILSNENYDINGQLIYSERLKKVVGIKQNVGESHHFWDKEFNRILKTINKALPDTTNEIVSFSRDERRFVILATSDTNSGEYYLWDRDSKRMQIFAYQYKALLPELMTAKESIDYEARDGLNIQGYLTRPKQNQNKPAPTIIFPHGGPISHDAKGFNYWTQFFASRGYNVLQMNFRGSSGYGHDFMTAGLKNWGKSMQTDIEDGTQWLIQQGIADPKRICIVGASYGGYAALMEASNNNGLYQCAISFAGVTDLPKLLTNSRRYVSYKVTKEMLGSKRKDLKQRSPVSRAKDINIPILLAHGSKDLVVPIEHGRKMNKRLTKHNKDITYLEFDGGTHYLTNGEYRVKLFEAMDEFLQKHL